MLSFGSEGQGVSEEIAVSCAVTIPTPGVTESLSVAVTGNINVKSHRQVGALSHTTL